MNNNKTKSFIKYSLIVIFGLVLIGTFISFLNNKFETARQAQEQSNQAKSDKEKESRKQDLLLQRESLNKNIQTKQKEGDTYKKLSDTYCGYLNPPAGSILLQTDYQTYFQQCEEYKRKAIDAYTQAQTLVNEYDSITQRLNTRNY